MEYNKMTNAELNLKMKALENEYDAKKAKIIELIHNLEKLDKEYIKVKEELNSRNILKDE